MTALLKSELRLIFRGGFRGAEPAQPLPFGRWTEAVTHGIPDMRQRIMATHISSLSLQTRKTWYLKYSK